MPIWMLALLAATLSAAAQAEDPDSARAGRPGNGTVFVSEIIDSTYFVGPAQFFALDLPSHVRGAKAVHVFGEVSVLGSGRRDIMVRLFRASNYQNWLKRRAGHDAREIWSSQRARTVRLDHPLPPGEPVVLLLDNGYSLRTPKRVRVQIQLHFDTSGAGSPGASETGSDPSAARAPEEGEIVPRGDTDDSVPPPPPPPPPDEGTN